VLRDKEGRTRKVGHLEDKADFVRGTAAHVGQRPIGSTQESHEYTRNAQEIQAHALRTVVSWLSE